MLLPTISQCFVVTAIISHAISFKIGLTTKRCHFGTFRVSMDMDVETTPDIRQTTYNYGKTVTIYRDSEIESSLDNSKTPLIFLPGLDGVGNYSASAVNKLNDKFDVWRLAIRGTDRSTFMELAQFVLKTIDTFDQPVVIMGESFGGLLATYIALRCKKGKISGLVLVNPATSFDRTVWPLLAPIIGNSGRAFPVVGFGALLATAVDFNQFQRIGRKIAGTINSTESAMTLVNTMFDSAKNILDLLPGETLNWRISNWFGTGNYLMAERYDEITVPTLILIGKTDRLLPSRDEGRRLAKLLKNSPKVELKEFDNGHALLEEDFIDIADEIMKSEILITNKDKMEAFLPSEADMKQVDEQFGRILKSFSTVFLSRSTDGTKSLVRGIENIPTGKDGRPVLLVGNHQLYGLDLAPIVKEFITEKQTLIRGLAHPMIMNQGVGSDRSMGKLFAKFGAVEVSPTSIFELLRRNETVMLFPGGIREAIHGRGEEYKLFWPERTDFVRMAGMFDAIIVPFASVGVAESLNIVFDREDMKKLPKLPSFLSNLASGNGTERGGVKLMTARAGVAEDFTPPIIFPKAPERIYFLFDEPIDTRGTNIYNKKECKELYEKVRTKVEESLVTVQRFRTADPYKDFIPRTLYEVASDGKQAPTAPLNIKC